MSHGQNCEGKNGFFLVVHERLFRAVLAEIEASLKVPALEKVNGK